MPPQPYYRRPVVNFGATAASTSLSYGPHATMQSQFYAAVDPGIFQHLDTRKIVIRVRDSGDGTDAREFKVPAAVKPSELPSLRDALYTALSQLVSSHEANVVDKVALQSALSHIGFHPLSHPQQGVPSISYVFNTKTKIKSYVAKFWTIGRVSKASRLTLIERKIEQSPTSINLGLEPPNSVPKDVQESVLYTREDRQYLKPEEEDADLLTIKHLASFIS